MRPPQRPQRKHRCGKNPLERSAQGIRVGAFATAGGIAMEDTAGAGAPEAGGALGEAGLQRAPSWIEKTFVGTASQPLVMLRDRPSIRASPDSQRFTSFPVFRENSSTRLLPELLTVEQVAAVLSTCTASLYKLCRYGGLPHTRVLNSIRVARADLEAYLRLGGSPR